MLHFNEYELKAASIVSSGHHPAGCILYLHGLSASRPRAGYTPEAGVVLLSRNTLTLEALLRIWQLRINCFGRAHARVLLHLNIAAGSDSLDERTFLPTIHSLQGLRKRLTLLPMSRLAPVLVIVRSFSDAEEVNLHEPMSTLRCQLQLALIKERPLWPKEDVPHSHVRSLAYSPPSQVDPWRLHSAQFSVIEPALFHSHCLCLAQCRAPVAIQPPAASRILPARMNSPQNSNRRAECPSV